jgi:hypothetical protein
MSTEGQQVYSLDETIAITDDSLFNYFLNDDLAHYSYDENSFSPSSDSPHTSPPQLMPDSPEFDTPQIPQVMLPAIIMNKNTLLEIKEECFSSEVTSGLVSPPMIANAVNRTVPPVTPQSHNKKRSLKDSNSAALSRDELLKLSTKGIETGSPSDAASKPVSSEEERQLKRQRRLIKNRESAQLSRMRKKIYIEELERKVSHLTSENDNLAKQLITVSHDKRKLEEEVIYLRNLMKQTGQLSTPNSQLVGQPIKQTSNPKLNTSSKNVKTAGLCLLVVLFSFGLLFNTNSNDIASISQLQPKSAYSARALKSIKEDNMKDVKKEEPSAVAMPLVESIMDTPKLLDSKENREVVSVKKPTDVTQVAPASLKRKKIPIADESAKDLVPVVAEEQVKQLKNNSLQVLPNGPTHHALSRPDTSYIYCSEAQQVHPASAAVGNTPQNIALLIPSSVLNATLDSRLDKSLLEVTCQVLNLHLWPYSTVPNNTMRP